MNSNIQKKNSNNSMTKCSKGGIKIRNTNNEYKLDPFDNIQPFTNSTDFNHVEDMYKNNINIDSIDLNINNYSREDLYKLFGLTPSIILTEDIMRESKKKVLKTHPDKSKLNNKYFLFFSSAYKQLFSIYEFQNKLSSKKKIDKMEYYDTDNHILLDKMFEKNKNLKQSNNFNEWFNTQFEKHKLEDPNTNGYGNWLKTDEDICFIPNISQSNMNSEIEKRKKTVQTITNYNGITEQFSSAFGASALMEYNTNFTSNSLFHSDGINYTDLKQAYIESVIPVTQEDYQNTLKFSSLDEYKKHRNMVDITPLKKEESIKQLYYNNQKIDQENAALAFHYAKQTEQSKEKQNLFWSGLKQIMN